jgi:hypothetical protein
MEHGAWGMGLRVESIENRTNSVINDQRIVLLNNNNNESYRYQESREDL